MTFDTVPQRRGPMASTFLPRKLLWWCTLISLLASHALIGTNDALRSFPTVDEVGHLPAGVSHWSFGRFDLYRVNPPLIRIVATAFTRDCGQYDWGFYRDNVGHRPEFDIGLQRIRHTP